MSFDEASHVRRFPLTAGRVGTGRTSLFVVSTALLLVGACGRVAETPAAPSSESEADASVPASLLPDRPPSPVVDDGGGWFRSHGCAIAAGPRAGGSDGGVSPTTFLEIVSEVDAGDASDASTAPRLHSAYETGAFAEGASAQRPSAVCGDRGVYFADEGCGRVAFAACEDEGSDAGGAARSCIYLATHTHLRPEERRTTPAGHFVDEAGRCWELVDASVALGADGITLGESQSGTFEALAVSGADERRLSGSFVACRAVAWTATCE
jgi:hypothetical protein